MSEPTFKRPNLREALAKAGTPTAAEIPTEKRSTPDRRKGTRSKALPSDAASKAPGSPKPTKSERSSISKDTKLDAELKVVRRQKRELERNIQMLQEQLDIQKSKADRAKLKVEEANQVFAELRRVVGAGRDAKADGIPNRISLRFKEFEAEVDAANGLARELRERIEAMEREVSRKDGEILHLQREMEPTLLNADAPRFIFGSPTDRESVGSIADEETESEGEVVPSLFSYFTSQNNLETIADRYCAWVLGLGEFRGALKNGPSPFRVGNRGQ